MFLTRLEDVLKLCYQKQCDLIIPLENVLKTSLQDVLKTCSKLLEDVLKMSWRRFCKRSCRRFETSWRRLENVLKTAWRRMTKTDVLVLIKTSWRRLKEVFWRRRVRRIYSSWPRRLEDVFWRRRRQTSWRRLEDVFIKTNVCWVWTLTWNCFSCDYILINFSVNLIYRIITDFSDSITSLLLWKHK